MKPKDFLEFFNEDLSELQSKVSGKYQTLKRGTLELVHNTIKSDELVDIQNFVSEYVDNQESKMLEGFIEESEVFDFYLKHKGDIDEMLTDKKFFDEPPTDNDIYSLYDFVIVGTKKAVVDTLREIKTENFQG